MSRSPHPQLSDHGHLDRGPPSKLISIQRFLRHAIQHAAQRSVCPHAAAFGDIPAIFHRYGIEFTHGFEDDVHDRLIDADTGWRIMLGRGLGIFQRYDDADWINPQVRHQRMRLVRGFTVTYVRAENELGT